MIRNPFFKILLIFFCLSFGLTAKANHIVGGDVTYSFVSFNSDSTVVTLEITFTMYRDTESQNAAGFDRPAEFGVYRELSPGNWRWVNTVFERPSDPEQIEYVDDPCRNEPTDVGVESGFYIFEVDLPVDDENYMIAYQRCCRNPTALNIRNPGDVGVAFNVLVTPLARELGNSSPTFKELPPLFICNQFAIPNIDVSAEDVDGDFLSYSFCTPTAAGGPGGGGCGNATRPDPQDCTPPFETVEFIAPYTTQAPMRGDPIVTINPFTGIISGVPTVEGQYIIGLCVEEYRNGELLSIVNRDFQFNSLTCTKELTAALRADGTEIGMANGANVLVNVIKACGDSSVFFENQSFGNELRTFDWEFYDSDGDVIYSRSDNESANFNLDFPELGEYTGILIANKGTDCPDTAFFRIERLPDMRTDFEYDSTSYDCYLAPIQFSDLSFTEQADLTEWNWSFADEETSDETDPTYQFQDRGIKTVTLISKDSNGCVDSMMQTVNYNPPHDEFLYEQIDETLCFGEAYDWYGEELTESGTMAKIIQYQDTGCDSVETIVTLDYSPPPMEVYPEFVLCPGEVLEYEGQTYTANGSYEDVTRFRGYNCDSLQHFITLTYDTLPAIDFSEKAIFIEAFEDYSIPTQIDGAYEQVIWSPADGLSCDDCPRPVVNYGTDTTYNLELVTEYGCRTNEDVFIDFVFIPDGYYLPTVISQNEVNKINRKFFVQTIAWAENEVFYDIEIYDRYGGLMHTKELISVNDETEAWQIYDIVPGTYTYYIQVHEFFETKMFTGTVTVIK